jgi:hypothetical protein
MLVSIVQNPTAERRDLVALLAGMAALMTVSLSREMENG